MDETVDAADYVRVFYTEPTLSEGVSRENEIFFTNPAIDAIRSNNAASGGCIDSNPFVDAQDYDIDEIARSLTVTANRAANGQMLVEVSFMSLGEAKYIVWTLVGSSGYWQVSDIEGSDPAPASAPFAATERQFQSASSLRGGKSARAVLLWKT